MIYTASYFQTIHHHGQLIPISRSIPKQYRASIPEHPLQSLLAPNADLLHWWKQQEEISIQVGDLFPNVFQVRSYTDRYRDQLRSKWQPILDYLNGLRSRDDETWLCREAPGEFCHRNLAYALVQRYRPDCLGGQNVERIEPPAPVFRFQPNQMVRLRKVPSLIYTAHSSFPETLSYPESVSLLDPNGNPAFWLAGQLELVGEAR